jgi:hypothetical protein
LASEGDEGLTPDAEDAFYIRRLDGGLFTLQTVDYIMGWLIMEDDGVSLSFIDFVLDASLNFLPCPDSNTRFTYVRSEKSVSSGYHTNFAIGF